MSYTFGDLTAAMSGHGILKTSSATNSKKKNYSESKRPDPKACNCGIFGLMTNNCMQSRRLMSPEALRKRDEMDELFDLRNKLLNPSELKCSFCSELACFEHHSKCVDGCRNVVCFKCNWHNIDGVKCPICMKNHCPRHAYPGKLGLACYECNGMKNKESSNFSYWATRALLKHTTLPKTLIKIVTGLAYATYTQRDHFYYNRAMKCLRSGRLEKLKKEDIPILKEFAVLKY